MCGSELTALPDGVQRVAAALQEKGHPHAPRMLDNSARTAQEAADALGIAVGQIAKSIIFRRKSDDAAVLVVTTLGPEWQGKLVYFMTVENAKFRKPVVPGDQMRVEVVKQRQRGNIWKFSAEAKVDGKVVAEATYAAMILDR